LAYHKNNFDRDYVEFNVKVSSCLFYLRRPMTVAVKQVFLQYFFLC